MLSARVNNFNRIHNFEIKIFEMLARKNIHLFFKKVNFILFILKALSIFVYV